MEEPSVLDYVKSKLGLRGPDRQKIVIPDYEGPSDEDLPVREIENIKEVGTNRGNPLWGWLAWLSVTCGLAAQILLDTQEPNVPVAIAFYSIAMILLVVSHIKNGWQISNSTIDEIEPSNGLNFSIRKIPFFLCVPTIMVSFWSFGGNEFNSLNLTIWFFLLILVLAAFWDGKNAKNNIGEFIKNLRNSPYLFKFSWWGFLLLLVVAVVLYFRFGQLDAIPGEMFSDHAEKLLDVSDVLNGQTSIFFPRNTGREAVQMYLTAFVATLLGTGLSFMSLKIGTALAGVLTLPYIYMLGKQVGNRWVGLIAVFLAGIAYWPNVISRVGLRFPLYPLFLAPSLYYLIKGLKTSNRNDYILSGIALGIGLQGYSPMRIVPFVFIVVVALYLLHPEAKGKRVLTLWAFFILGFFSLIMFLPLFRYAIDDPQMFAYRAFTRVGTTEREFPAPVLLVFFQNLWRSLIMFFWKNGDIWVHSVPGRPALEIVTAVFYLFGQTLVFIRYLRKRNWLDLVILVLVPLLMLPSILSLAFPDENPSLNRSGAAIVPVFILAAIAFEGLISTFYKKTRSGFGKASVIVVGICLIIVSMYNNYDLIFNNFKNQFLAGAWNTSEIGKVIRGFANSVGTPDTAYVVPFPYWVDTRLVGINAGYPTKDYALWPEQFGEISGVTENKLFIIKEEDQPSLEKLIELYPNSVYTLHTSPLEGKNFYVLMVPQEK